MQSVQITPSFSPKTMDDRFSQALSERRHRKHRSAPLYKSSPVLEGQIQKWEEPPSQKIKWSTLPPSKWPVSRTHANNSREGLQWLWDQIPTVLDESWTRYMCSLRRSITSQQPVVSPLPVWWPVFHIFVSFLALSYSVRHGYELYIMFDAPERIKKRKKRELLFSEACIASKEIVAAYLNRTVEHVNGSDSSFLNMLLQVESTNTIL